METFQEQFRIIILYKWGPISDIWSFMHVISTLYVFQISQKQFKSEWMSSGGLDYITANPSLQRGIINQEKSQKTHVEVLCMNQVWILIDLLKAHSHQKWRNGVLTKGGRSRSLMQDANRR